MMDTRLGPELVDAVRGALGMVEDPELGVVSVAAAKRVTGVSAFEAELVFEPPWSPELMGDEVKFALGFLG